MHGQSYSRVSENGQFMSNKQVIAIFAVGILMMLAAFWAGLSVIKGSASDGGGATVGGGKAAAQPPVPEAAPSGTAAAAANPPTANGSAKYVVRVAAYGTHEEAQKDVDELKNARYLSAHVRLPNAESPLYKVFIGPFELRDAAHQVANELAAAGKKGLMVSQDSGDR